MLLLFIFLSFTSLLFADAEHTDQLLQENLARYPGLQAAEVKFFYQEYAPELLQELSTYAAESQVQTSAFLRQLLENYQELQRIKKENNTLYQWRLKKLKEEIALRKLGFEIKILTARLREKNVLQEAALTLEIYQKKKELKKKLEEAFVEAEQEQQIEINRLEAEINILKQLMEERKANKQMILQEKFKSLSGEQE